MSLHRQQQTHAEEPAWELDGTSDHFSVEANQVDATSMESPYIIKLNIEHYRALLNLACMTERMRPQVEKLLVEATMQLSAAAASSPAIAMAPVASCKSSRESE